MMFQNFKEIEEYINKIKQGLPEIYRKLKISSDAYTSMGAMAMIDSIEIPGFDEIRKQIGIEKPKKKLRKEKFFQNASKKALNDSMELGTKLVYLDFFEKFNPFIDKFISHNKDRFIKKPDKKFDYHLGIFTNTIARLLPIEKNWDKLTKIGFYPDQLLYLLLNQYMAIIELLKNIYVDAFEVQMGRRGDFYVSNMISDFKQINGEFDKIKHYFDSKLRNAIGHSNFSVRDGKTNPYIEYKYKDITHKLYITLWDVNTGEFNIDLKKSDNFFGMILGIKFFTMMFYFKLLEFNK